MKQKFKTDGLECTCVSADKTSSIAYILYPMAIPDSWIDRASKEYGVNIAVITGMDWDNVFSPWPAPGQPPGSPDFKGESDSFLDTLCNGIIPEMEKRLQLSPDADRTLFGVSMSGLFALWQWMVCDTFTNIACLSGSFWYPGFMQWFQQRPVMHKTGKAYFLLGVQEPYSPVKAFRSVGVNTQDIIAILKKENITVEFQSVPGNHFSDPMPRLDKAFEGIYG